MSFDAQRTDYALQQALRDLALAASELLADARSGVMFDDRHDLAARCLELRAEVAELRKAVARLTGRGGDLG